MANTEKDFNKTVSIILGLYAAMKISMLVGATTFGMVFGSFQLIATAYAVFLLILMATNGIKDELERRREDREFRALVAQHDAEWEKEQRERELDHL